MHGGESRVTLVAELKRQRAKTNSMRAEINSLQRLCHQTQILRQQVGSPSVSRTGMSPANYSALVDAALPALHIDECASMRFSDVYLSQPGRAEGVDARQLILQAVRVQFVIDGDEYLTHRRSSLNAHLITLRDEDVLAVEEAGASAALFRDHVAWIRRPTDSALSSEKHVTDYLALVARNSLPDNGFFLT